MFLIPKNTSRQLIERIQLFVTLCILTPGYFMFQLVVMRPQIIEILNMSQPIHFFHVALSTYFFINVFGNMVLSVIVDTTLTKYQGEGPYCETCKQNQSAQSWHCPTCNACVIRRDHHCTFLARCVGRHNQRYFICLLAHLTIALTYATYYDFFLVAYQYDPIDFLIETGKVFNPMLRYFSSEPIMGLRDLLMTFWCLNLGLLCGVAILLYFHLNNVLNGLTCYEAKKMVMGKRCGLENVRYVLGTKWYLAVLWPFVDSPLPAALG